MITITVRDAQDQALAQTSHPTEALLCFDREYQAGDRIEVESGEHRHLWLRLDAALEPGEVYAPAGRMTYAIPQGDERLAYAPAAFAGTRHILSARAMTVQQTRQRRNIACDPADLRGETDFYPHATANVETRDEAVFAARNVIDGMRYHTSHGEWPYQSWGIGARTDAWCMLDLGREALVDEMALVLRADFPHDAYWLGGHVVMSDGSDVAFDLQKTGERQHIPLGEHRVRWLRLERLQKSDDPSAFPALIEWEVYGSDIG